MDHLKLQELYAMTYDDPAIKLYGKLIYTDLVKKR